MFSYIVIPYTRKKVTQGDVTLDTEPGGGEGFRLGGGYRPERTPGATDASGTAGKGRRKL